MQLHFWRNHFYYPLAAFILLALFVELGEIDMRIADFWYALEGGHWALKDAWLTSTLIHKVGKYLSLLIALAALIALIKTYITPQQQRWRRELTYLLLAAGGSSLLIVAIKSTNHASCAWDFVRYGGSRPYTTVFAEFLHGTGRDCFPAGHASSGYAWIALYFLGVHLQSRWRWMGLISALFIGLIFGISQQLRGAHFISHDLWTLGICWFFSLTLYRLMLLNYKNLTLI